MQKAESVIKELKRHATPARAKASAWFFKTEKGQYGYGDVFWGLSVPEQRFIATQCGDLSLREISKLITHKVHECRMTALLILVGKYRRADAGGQKEIVRFYLKNAGQVNNWDLVDLSAPYILGNYLLDKNTEVLYKCARSQNLWERRIAIVATFAFIREERFADTLKIGEILLGDKHDLIHKAVGWMLREVGKRSSATEEKFLKKYAHSMPRTMLRYAIEKFPEKKRARYLALRSIKKRRK